MGHCIYNSSEKVKGEGSDYSIVVFNSILHTKLKT